MQISKRSLTQDLTSCSRLKCSFFLLPTFLNIWGVPRYHPKPHMLWQLVHHFLRPEPALAESPGSWKRNLRTPVKKKDGHKVSQRQPSILTGRYFSYSASPRHSSLAVGVWGSTLSYQRSPSPTPGDSSHRGLEIRAGVRGLASQDGDSLSPGETRRILFANQSCGWRGFKMSGWNCRLLRNRSKC